MAVRRPLVALLAVLATVLAAAAAAGAQPLASAVFDPFDVPPDAAAISELRAAGAGAERMVVSWSQVAPVTPPPGFDAANPADPAYRWASVDAEVQALVAGGLQPIVDVVGAPAWAARAPAIPADYPLGPDTPDATAFGRFALAIATRYSGSFQGLPRVRYWQVYNEPNLDHDLRPQYADGAPASPAVYRDLVNAFAGAVHSVHADNLVVAGGLTPFTFRIGGTLRSVPPMEFMRDLLCMSAGAHPHPTCSDTVEFDVWSHHPYTTGGPTHKAASPGDVSLGDLPEMHALLTAAAAAHHIVSRQPPQFWVTEFSWDSSPPDPKAVPATLLERWVPLALHQMWSNGVSLVAWFGLRDQPYPSSPFQSGLYFADGKPKPYLEGFRFPLVALRSPTGYSVWGRTPDGRPGTVVVEQRSGGAWRRIGSLRTDRYGIFRHAYLAKTTGYVRARLAGGETTLAFPLAPIPDRSYPIFG